MLQLSFMQWARSDSKQTHAHFAEKTILGEKFLVSGLPKLTDLGFVCHHQKDDQKSALVLPTEFGAIGKMSLISSRAKTMIECFSHEAKYWARPKENAFDKTTNPQV